MDEHAESPGSGLGGFTRRSLLAGGAAGALSVGGLPAWARPVARGLAIRSPDSLPFPDRPIGTRSTPQVEHIVVLMMRDRSFDALLGMVPIQVPGRQAVDGLTSRWARRNGQHVPAGQPPVDRLALPFTYALVGDFPVGQRYFASTNGQAIPTAASCSPARPPACSAPTRRRSPSRPPTAPSGTGSTRPTSSGASTTPRCRAG